MKIPDANAPFRLMNTTTLARYIDKFEDNYALPNIMVTTYFVRYNEKFIFKNISFESRQHGKNSINVSKIIKIGFKSLCEFWRFRKEMR